MKPEIAPRGEVALGAISPSLQVVVGCTSRKRAVAPERLRLGSVGRTTTSARVRAWVRRLATVPAPVLHARDLYAGDHWQIALNLSTRRAVQVSVVSAGYGLVELGRRLKPYSASFSAGEDCVVGEGVPRRDERLREWWQLLCEAPLGSLGPHTLRELVECRSEAVFLVVLSKSYLRAVADDLRAARRALAPDGRMIVISSEPWTEDDDLAGSLVRVDATLQPALGGARSSLYARIARHLVKTADAHRWEIAAVAATLDRLKRSASHGAMRQSSSDAAVKAFIAAAIRIDPNASKTRLLREWRDAGSACEQRRFGLLYEASQRS